MKQPRKISLHDFVGFEKQRAQLCTFMQGLKDPTAPRYALVTAPPGSAKMLAVKLAIGQAEATEIRLQITAELRANESWNVARQAIRCEGPVVIVVDSLDYGDLVAGLIWHVLDLAVSARQDILVIATLTKGQPVPSDFQNIPTIEFDYLARDEELAMLRAFRRE